MTAPPSTRRTTVLTAGALLLTATGVALAVLQPPWLTEPLRDAVLGAGTAGPVVFVLLCVLVAPLHLTGLLTALSVVIWPLPVAAALSFVGGVLGCTLTAAVLARVGAGRATLPPWLQRLAGRVARRPLLVGTGVRFVLQAGIAVEAFYLLTGYTRRQYAIATALGYGLYVAQAVLGIVALTALVQVSPWLGVLLVAVPLVAVAVVGALRARAAS